jgi:hypothetical protein
MRRFGRAIWRLVNRRFVKWPLAASGLLVFLSCLPVAYVELACRGDANATAGASRAVMTDPVFHRREANTYLTYPEWHIVYAYDGLAETLETGDEYTFDYFASVDGFWRATCSLMRVGDSHGGADWATRSMIHTIGVSFTVEMALKALYEETIGRATAWLRGPGKTPQDQAVAAMAIDYAAFLRQTPWYAYPFRREVKALWAEPAGVSPRRWERRLGIGAEFLAKAAYAKVIAGAVAAAEPAKLEIRSIVTGIDRQRLEGIQHVRVIGRRAGGIEIETPRYDLFTHILVTVARHGGSVLEIAGNDDIMVTITVPRGFDSPLAHGREIMRMKRSGFPGERLLVDVKVKDLAALLKAHPMGDPGLEHVFDY